MTVPPLLPALVGREMVYAAELAELVSLHSSGGERPALEELLSLWPRLYAGLTETEAVWLVERAPPVAEALGSGSPWFRDEQGTVIREIRPGSAALVGFLTELGRFGAAARRVADRLERRPDLVELLASERSERQGLVELSHVLESSLETVESLDLRAPGLRLELAAMARRRFTATVHIHHALRPESLREQGRQMADWVLAEAPAGPFALALSDDELLLEHVSPYVRDLCHSLYAWAHENPSEISDPALSKALNDSRTEPHPDLAALVVPDLLRVAPHLVNERRQVEAEGGLFSRAWPAGRAGWALLDQIPQTDPRAVPPGAEGTLVLLSSASVEVHQEALRVFLASGRVSGLGLLAGLPGSDPRVVIASGLVTENDGVWLERAPEIAERADALDVPWAAAGGLDVDPRVGTAVAFSVLGALRRAAVTGTAPLELRPTIVFHPLSTRGNPQELAFRLAALDGARLVLSEILAPSESSPKRSRRKGERSASRRLRA